MGAVEEMMCIVCVMLQWGHSGDGCDFVPSLCEYDLRQGDVYVLGKGAKSEAGKDLFRFDNVWWRYAQYFVVASCG